MLEVKDPEILHVILVLVLNLTQDHENQYMQQSSFINQLLVNVSLSSIS